VRQNWLHELRADAAVALRQLRRSPGFALVATSTLALGIGATTAVFAVIDAVMLRPLPFRQADQLVIVRREDLAVRDRSRRHTRNTASFAMGRSRSPDSRRFRLPIGGGVLLRSVAHLNAAPLGVDRVHRLTAELFLRDTKYADPAWTRAFFRDAVARVRQIPGDCRGRCVASTLAGPDGSTIRCRSRGRMRRTA
jgi:hypothetical protein